jgi:hippurate hydrolase
VPKLIALRTDMDGLHMPENNPDLAYRTQTDHAHMCGHDGHMATLLAAAKVIHKMKHKIPKDQGVRLLF